MVDIALGHGSATTSARRGPNTHLQPEHGRPGGAVRSFVLGVVLAMLLLRVSMVAGLVSVSFLLVAVALILAVGVIARWEALWVVPLAYLLIPSPADNAFLDVGIFPPDEGAAAIDVFVFGDLVLCAFLVHRLRDLSRYRRIPTWWIGLLVAVAVTPILAALPLSYPWPAATWGVAFALRGALIWTLVSCEIERNGPRTTTRYLERAVVVGSAALGASATLVKIALWGQEQVVVHWGDEPFRVLFDGRVRLPGWGNNTLAAVIVIGFSVAVLFGRERLMWPRYLVLGCIAAQASGLVATQMRVPMVLASGVVVWRMARWFVAYVTRWRTVVVVAMSFTLFSAVLLLGGILWALNPRFGDVGGRAVDLYLGRAPWERPGDGTFVNRGQVTRTAVSVIVQRPALGHGWGSWGWVRTTFDKDARAGMDPHSDYLIVLAEAGILGLFGVFVVPSVVLVRSYLRRWRSWRLAPMSLAHFVVLGIVGLVATNIHNPRYSALYWLLLATTVGLLRQNGGAFPEGEGMSAGVGSHSDRLLDVTVDVVDRADLTRSVEGYVSAGRRSVIGHHNLHSLYLVGRDAAMARFYERADLVHADGMGVILLSRLLGGRLRSKHRTAYIDWVPELLELCQRRGWRVFYLGARPGVADRAFGAYFADKPQLFASHHGYFEADGEQLRGVLTRIRAFQPDLLFVGMGMPLQERWVVAAFDDLPACVVLTCGGCADFFAGEQRMPPRWLGRIGLEWLHRLVNDPRRLASRYLWEPMVLAPEVLRELVLRTDGTTNRVPVP